MICSSAAYSQDVLTSTIEWNSVLTFDTQNGLMIDEATKVVSSPTSITWYDSSDAVRYSLNVTGSEGTWTNVSGNGHILFYFNGDKAGVIEFRKEGTSIKVLIHFMLEDGKSIYELRINNVNSL